jgi:glycosyltransferase involved in cell wall biosynthesis
LVVVSDDSATVEVQLKNRQVVEQYPGSIYILGPQSGACANRNNAFNAVSDADLVSFIDDDIVIDHDFIARAIERYQGMSPEQRQKTILTGVGWDVDGNETIPSKLSFRGYFCASQTPQVVDIHAAVFPFNFPRQEKWDTNIFIGQEDAELCLRALKNDFRILHCPELRALDSGRRASSLDIPNSSGLTDYEVYIEASRLYVGVKRYKVIFPDPLKLLAFIIIYFSHMTIYLTKRRSLRSLTEIVRRSNLGVILKLSSY